MERRLPVHQIRRLGFREQTAPWSETNLGPGNFAQVYPPRRAARRDSETIRMAYISTLFRMINSRHSYSSLLRSVGTDLKVMQELLRHSSFRSTLDVYTQAITPAKHAAQAAVLSLVFSSTRSDASISDVAESRP